MILAERSFLAPDIAEALSFDLNTHIRTEIAVCFNTPVKIPKRLSLDKETIVRQGVAANSTTPSITLGRLLEDRTFMVRMTAANNPKVPLEAIKKTAKKKSRSLTWNKVIRDRLAKEIAL